jgi:hypothetical protein
MLSPAMSAVIGALVIGLLATVAVSTDATAPKPVKGIDVIVRKHPGTTAVRTQATDLGGTASFGVLEAGTYEVSIGAPNGPKAAAAPRGVARVTQSSTPATTHFSEQ